MDLTKLFASEVRADRKGVSRFSEDDRRAAETLHPDCSQARR